MFGPHSLGMLRSLLNSFRCRLHHFPDAARGWEVPPCFSASASARCYGRAGEERRACARLPSVQLYSPLCHTVKHVFSASTLFDGPRTVPYAGSTGVGVLHISSTSLRGAVLRLRGAAALPVCGKIWVGHSRISPQIFELTGLV